MEKEIPTAITQGDVLFDIDEVDGQISMFDRSFAGSIVLPLFRKMDETIKGKVTVNDIELDRVWLRTFTQIKIHRCLDCLYVTSYGSMEGHIRFESRDS